MAYLRPHVERQFVPGECRSYVYRDVRGFVDITTEHGETQMSIDDFLELIGRVLLNVMTEKEAKAIVDKLAKRWK